MSGKQDWSWRRRKSQEKIVGNVVGRTKKKEMEEKIKRTSTVQLKRGGETAGDALSPMTKDS